MRTARLVAILAAIFAAAALRLVPHPPNFTPIGAMALFSGAISGARPIAFAAPLGALLLSDLVLGFYHGMAFVYVSVALIVMIGWWRSAPLLLRVGAAAWRARSCSSSSPTSACGCSAASIRGPLAGLEACYVAAIPFFQNTVAGDLFYAGLLFGGFALLQRAVPALRSSEAPQPA